MLIAISIVVGTRLAGPAVSLTLSATRLPLAVERLSQATGKRLQVAPALQEEVLLMRVKDVAAPTLLDKIAKLYDARWDTRTDGRLILQPDNVLIRKRQNERQAKDAHQLEAGLTAVRQSLDRQPVSLTRAELLAWAKRKADEEAAYRRALESEDYDRVFRKARSFEENPAWRATAALALNIPVSTYLEIPPDGRRVYAEHPTPMQVAFGFRDATVLARYRTEMATFAPEIDIQRVRLIVNRWEYGGSCNINLEALDGNGKVVHTGGLSLREEMTLPEPPEEVRGAPKITLSPDAVELQTLVNMESKDAELLDPLLDKWTPFLTDPVKFEPLQLLPSETYIAIAETMGRNLIARPSDLSVLRYSKRADFEVLASAYPSFSRTLLRDPDGWLVSVGPPEVSRISRDSARRLIQGAYRAGGLSVDAAAEFAETSPDPFPFSNWAGDWLGTLFPSSGRHSVLATTLNEPMLRLWHALGSDARKALRSGQTVRISTLSAAAQAQIYHWVYEEADEGEPTEQYPNGIRDGVLRVVVSQQTIFKAWAQETGSARRAVAFTPAEFGRYLAKGNPGRSQTAEEFRKRNRFQVGSEVTYELQLDLGQGQVPLTQKLSEVFFPPRSEARTALPSAIQSEVEAARTEALRSTPTPTRTNTEVTPP